MSEKLNVPAAGSYLIWCEICKQKRVGAKFCQIIEIQSDLVIWIRFPSVFISYLLILLVIIISN